MSGDAKAATRPPLVRIAWLRNELRVRDNYVLQQAAAGGAAVLPCVVFEQREYPRNRRRPEFSTLDAAYVTAAKTGPYRAKFHRECVIDLRKNLKSLCNAPLLVAFGKPDQVLAAVAKSLPLVDGKPAEIVCSETPCWEEQQAEKSVSDAVGGRLTRVHDTTMYHPDDILKAAQLKMPRDLLDVCTPWRSRVEKANTKIRPPAGPARLGTPLPVSLLRAAETAAAEAALQGKAGLEFVPSLAFLLNQDDRNSRIDDDVREGGKGHDDDDDDNDEKEEEEVCSDVVTQLAASDMRGDFFAPTGGETSGLARVEQYIWDEDRLRVYFDTRNGMVGQGYSTKFAPWLAKGCISARFIAAECRRYERERGISNKSTYWVKFELTVRDYFFFYAAKYGRRLFFEYGVKGVAGGGKRGPWRTPQVAQNVTKGVCVRAYIAAHLCIAAFWKC